MTVIVVKKKAFEKCVNKLEINIYKEDKNGAPGADYCIVEIRHFVKRGVFHFYCG